MSDLQEIFSKRIEEIVDEVSKEDWYIDTQSKIISLRKAICNNIDDDTKKLLDLYDELCFKIDCKTIDEIYVAAYKDGISAATGSTPKLTPK